jgi:hypothetical protein
MTKRPAPPLRDSRATNWPAGCSLVAWGVVLLQLFTALHFGLVPHGFNANLGGFVHVHTPAVQASSNALRPAQRVSVVAGSASCASDSCPIGFAGPVSALLASASLSGLIALPVVVAVQPLERARVDRARVLSSAPKTSPPGLV